MSPDAHKHHIRRWFDALNQGTALDVIDETYAPDYVLHDPTLPEPVRGVEGIRAFIAALLAGFPDARYTVEDLIAEGDRVVQRCSVRGTHRGPFLGVPATGKSVAIPFMIISRFDGEDRRGVANVARPRAAATARRDPGARARPGCRLGRRPSMQGSSPKQPGSGATPREGP